jgi:scyllo-inosamine 4-kinase
VTEELEWVLAREVTGRNLGEAWPTLCWEARLCALRQLWARARAVHATDVLRAQAVTASESPFYASSPAQAAAQLARLQEAGILVSTQVAVLAKVLDRYWAALESAPRVLCHGDLCTENALWHDGTVVALLDLEYAVVAPVELDLNELVKSAFAPPESVDPLPDPDGAGLERVRQTVTEIAAATMTTPGSVDRLLGYALLLDLWAMENELSIEGSSPGTHTILAPYRALQLFADGTGGYLAPFLARLEDLKGEQDD